MPITRCLMRKLTEDDSPEGANARRWVFVLWAALCAFVGTQMAWALRPFILFEQAGGSLCADILNSANVLLGLGRLL